ncbi:hypothetical protein ACERJO_10195 [Halalkalibacter sp. AB-rgal2]|uniref:hypothetical protein n=1 Tax=Halalkalibacter sp. AB-rgal2 TaxID=3242695 RepID=UPI00359E4A5B
MTTQTESYFNYSEYTEKVQITRSLKKSFLVTQGRVMAPLVARLAMRNLLIARLSKSGNGYAHYFKATEKVKTKLFQWPPNHLFLYLIFTINRFTRCLKGHRKS